MEGSKDRSPKLNVARKSYRPLHNLRRSKRISQGNGQPTSPQHAKRQKTSSEKGSGQKLSVPNPGTESVYFDKAPQKTQDPPIAGQSDKHVEEQLEQPKPADDGDVSD